MAGGTAQRDDLDEILAEICQRLKRHEQQAFDLACEVEGLKATLTGADRLRSDPAKLRASEHGRDEVASRIHSLDAIIERLRRI